VKLLRKLERTDHHRPLKWRRDMVLIQRLDPYGRGFFKKKRGKNIRSSSTGGMLAIDNPVEISRGWGQEGKGSDPPPS